MAGWANDTHVVNCSNVEGATVEVSLPESTNDYESVEVTLSDGSNNAVATVSGGETTVYAVLDCSDLDDGDLTLTARAYNAAGTSPTLGGDDAVKDATAPTITVTEPDDDICLMHDAAAPLR